MRDRWFRRQSNISQMSKTEIKLGLLSIKQFPHYTVGPLFRLNYWFPHVRIFIFWMDCLVSFFNFISFEIIQTRYYNSKTWLNFFLEMYVACKMNQKRTRKGQAVIPGQFLSSEKSPQSLAPSHCHEGAKQRVVNSHFWNVTPFTPRRK